MSQNKAKQSMCIFLCEVYAHSFYTNLKRSKMLSSTYSILQAGNNYDVTQQMIDDTDWPYCYIKSNLHR